jgi:hypothetical protein
MRTCLETELGIFQELAYHLMNNLLAGSIIGGRGLDDILSM